MLGVHDEVVTEFWLTTLGRRIRVGLCGHTAALTGVRHVISRCLFRVSDHSVFTPGEVGLMVTHLVILGSAHYDGEASLLRNVDDP